MKNALTKLSILPLLLLGLTAGCSSLDYDDPDMVETLTIDFGSTDLQQLAGSMSESLIASPGLAYLDHSGKGEDKRIIVFTGEVDNRTTEHIDTQGITDSIRVSLLKSGKFRIVTSDAGQAEVGDQVSFQQGSGRVDLDMAKAFGRQLGADVVLYGTLRSIDKREGGSLETLGTRKRDLYYQFVLECVNIETGEVIWMDEEDIRKRKSTGLLGR